MAGTEKNTTEVKKVEEFAEKKSTDNKSLDLHANVKATWKIKKGISPTGVIAGSVARFDVRELESEDEIKAFNDNFKAKGLDPILEKK